MAARRIGMMLAMAGAWLPAQAAQPPAPQAGQHPQPAIAPGAEGLRQHLFARADRRAGIHAGLSLVEGDLGKGGGSGRQQHEAEQAGLFHRAFR